MRSVGVSDSDGYERKCRGCDDEDFLHRGITKEQLHLEGLMHILKCENHLNVISGIAIFDPIPMVGMSGAMDDRPVNPARAGMQQRQSSLSCRSPLTLFTESILASYCIVVSPRVEKR